ncbi:MAG: type II secretion system secretin GspD [Sphingomonadaceae bacterium]
MAHAQQTLNVRDADIRAFIQDASRVTGRTFIIDNRVQGKVSVVTERPLSRSEYFEVFLSTLRANGLVAVPSAGGAFRIQPLDTAASQPGRVGSAGAARNQFVTEVIRLRSVDAASAVETIRPLVSREGSVTANRSGNSIVIADFADNIRRVRDLVRRIDTDNVLTRVIPLRNAGAREIATSLSALAAGGGQGATPVAVTAIDSSNSIALRGDPATVSRFADIIADLDKRAATGSEIRVVFLQHADAEKLVPVLQQLVGQATGSVVPQVVSAERPSLPGTSRPPAPDGGGASGGAISMGGGKAVIARYEGANAVIVSAPSDLQRTLGEVIRQLDTRREQVLVEAIIVEISDTAARRLGVQFLLGSTDGSVPFAATNYSNAQPNILTLGGAVLSRELNNTTTTVNGTTTVTTSGSGASDTLTSAAVSQVLGAAGGLFGYGTTLGGGGVFGTILNAVSQDNKSNILSTPSVVTLDNQEAKILVGQEVPITTGQALGGNFDNAFRTVTRQNVGIQLEVKPQIGEGGAIKLFLRQEVSSIAGAVSNSDSDLILNKREISTTVTVDDGQIIALGGLLDDNERRTIEKIPLLGDVPVLGELFKSRSKARTKTNLMVFIRPTIMRSAADAQRLAAQRYGYIRDRQLIANPKTEPSLDELVRDYMGTVAPTAPLPTDTVVVPGPTAGPVPTVVVPAGKPVIIIPEVRSSTTTIRPVDVPPSKAPPR